RPGSGLPSRGPGACSGGWSRRRLADRDGSGAAAPPPPTSGPHAPNRRAAGRPSRRPGLAVRCRVAPAPDFAFGDRAARYRMWRGDGVTLAEVEIDTIDGDLTSRWLGLVELGDQGLLSILEHC